MSRRAEASSAGGTSTRTPCSCNCGSCPPASSAARAALTPRLRRKPTMNSASMRLVTTATGTVAPSMTALPLFSAEREAVRLDAGVEEFDLEPALGDPSALADQLVTALVRDGPVAVGRVGP